MNPPVVADPYEEMRDDSHLRLLIIFHYVMGILELLGGLAFMGVAIFMGKMMRQISTLPTAIPAPTPTLICLNGNRCKHVFEYNSSSCWIK